MSFLSSFNLGSMLAASVPTTGINGPITIEPNPGQSPYDASGMAGAMMQLPGVSDNTAGSAASNTAGSGVSNTMSNLSNWMQKQAQALSSGLQGGAQSSANSQTDTLTRLASGIIGLICIAGGLFMFKGTRDVVVNTAKTAAKVAAVMVLLSVTISATLKAQNACPGTAPNFTGTVTDTNN